MAVKDGPVDYFDRCWVESVIRIARADNPHKHGGTIGFSYAEARRVYREYVEQKAQFGEVPREQDPTWLSSYAGRKALEEAQRG